MDLHKLRYFVALAERLHFSGAAELVHVSHPGLCQQIKALELEHGIQIDNESLRQSLHRRMGAP